MKKAVLLIAALVVLGGFAFGQATVGAWGRGIFVPVLGGGDDIMTKLGATWGADAARIGMTISGTSDNVGFQADILADGGGGINGGDNQKIWVKPIEMLTITVGTFFDDTLRGDAVFGAWNWLRYDQINGENALFVRVCQNGVDYMRTNVEVALAPVEGAYIFASLSGVQGPQVLLEDALPLGQYGGGYTIEGIGQIKLQYLGMPTGIDEDWGIINAAFKLTMIDGLVAELGAGIPTDSDQAGGLTAAIALYAKYSMDALTIHAYGDVSLYDQDIVGEDNTLGFTIAGGLDYSLEGGIGINADLRYKNDVATGLAYEDGAISGMAGVTMGFSNGLFGIAIEVTTGTFAGGPAPAGFQVVKNDPSDMVFAIPIRLEYWF